MFSFAISLIRDIIAACIRRGGASRSYRIPSIRYRTRRFSSLGSMWMSDASEVTASSISRLTSRTTGASKAMSRSWLTSSSPSASSPGPIPSTIFCSAVDAPYVGSMASRIAAGATQSLTCRRSCWRSTSMISALWDPRWRRDRGSLDGDGTHGVLAKVLRREVLQDRQRGRHLLPKMNGSFSWSASAASTSWRVTAPIPIRTSPTSP